MLHPVYIYICISCTGADNGVAMQWMAAFLLVLALSLCRFVPTKGATPNGFMDSTNTEGSLSGVDGE